MALFPLQLATLFYTIVSLSLFTLFSYQRIVRRVKALDYFVVIFGLISSAGMMQFLRPILGENSWLLSLYHGTISPLFYDPVRVLGIIMMIVVYTFAEHTIRERPATYRVGLIMSFSVIFVAVFLYFEQTGNLILMNQLIPFLQPTRFDEFAYDMVFAIALTMVTYSFYHQYRIADIIAFKRNLLILLGSLVLFDITYIIEISEHFAPIPDIDFVFFSIPFFFALGYVYLTHPNFVYYSPTEVHFMQVATVQGHLIFVSELQRTADTRDFLVPVSLSSINSLFMEIIGINREETSTTDISLETITFDQGVLLFEKLDQLFVILYTEKSSLILKRSIRYFIREFNRTYADQIKQFEGGFVYHGEIFAEPLIRQCIPMVQSKEFKSRVRDDVPGGVF